MGLLVVGLGLLDISMWFLILLQFYPNELIIITTTMLTFEMGTSSYALFARVGGGIYTKAADVGADLYESYCGSILATTALGATAFTTNLGVQFNAVIAPMLIAGLGIIASLIGIYMVRSREEATQKNLLQALSRGLYTSSAIIAGSSFLILYLLDLENWVGIGIVIVIGLATQFFTSASFRPTREIAKSEETGPATVIISGIGYGMISTMIPVLAVIVAIILAFLFASGFDFSNIAQGLYGIGIAAVAKGFAIGSAALTALAFLFSGVILNSVSRAA